MTRKEQDTNRTSAEQYSGVVFHNMLAENQMRIDAPVAQTGLLRSGIGFGHKIQYPGKQDIHRTGMSERNHREGCLLSHFKRGTKWGQ